MSTDNLDQLSDERLSEIFTHEVVGTTWKGEDYAEDANAVLQWLDDCEYFIAKTKSSVAPERPFTC